MGISCYGVSLPLTQLAAIPLVACGGQLCYARLERGGYCSEALRKLRAGNEVMGKQQQLDYCSVSMAAGQQQQHTTTALYSTSAETNTHIVNTHFHHTDRHKNTKHTDKTFGHIYGP